MQVQQVFNVVVRASARTEHFGFVSLAAVDVFHLEQITWLLSVLLLISGSLALYRDCRLWYRDEDRRAAK